MTNQERINHAVEQIDTALHTCNPPLPVYVIRETMAWVFEAAFAILAGKAHNEAQLILHGLIKQGYTPEIADKWIRECVDLRQYDELDRKKKNGLDLLSRYIDGEKYEQLLQLLLERIGDQEPDEEEASDEDLESLMEEYPAVLNSVDEHGNMHTVATISQDWDPEEDPADESMEDSGADDDT